MRKPQRQPEKKGTLFTDEKDMSQSICLIKIRQDRSAEGMDCQPKMLYPANISFETKEKERKSI